MATTEFKTEAGVDHTTDENFVIRCLDNGNKYYCLHRGYEQQWKGDVEMATTYSSYGDAQKVITEEIELDGNFSIDKIFRKTISY